MAKRKVVVTKTQIDEKYKQPPLRWYWFVRKKGFLQPVPYKYKIPDLKPLIEYAKNI